MVNSCVAAGCNRTCKDGVSLFTFPKNTLLRKKWIDQVRRTRENWEPTEHSRLCSRHFEVGCFEPCSKLSETFGMKKIKPGLKIDAVPTLFERSVPKKRASSKSTTDHEPAKKRTAYEKRERARVSNSCNT